jgi:hypothetical protein
MRRLMQKIEEIEIKEQDELPLARRSSYSPVDYVPCMSNGVPRSSGGKNIPQQAAQSECGGCCRFLPCHYFDYIGGTSTGG